jgi:hypothetical protein
MLILPADRAFSRHLLVRGLRYARECAFAKKRLVVVAEGFDPSIEDRPDGYDSPWRSLGLLFRICDRPDLSDTAFKRAEQWFETMLAAATENPVLRAAWLTMQALCRSQAGKAGGVSAELLQLVKSSLQSMQTTNAEFWSRHVSLNCRRIDFLAHYCHIDNEDEFVLRQADSLEALAARKTVQELKNAVFALWGDCRLAVEVGDSEILLNNLQRMWNIGELIVLACNSGELESGRETEVALLLRGYLAAIDFCEPTSDEAVRGLDVICPVVHAFRLQGTQAIEDRAALLLARSVVANTVVMSDVPQMVESIAGSIARCVDVAKRVGLNSELISRRIRHAFLEFAAGDVRRYCAALASAHDRIETLKHVCSAARSLKVQLDSATVKDITALCIAGAELPVAPLAFDAPTNFGESLRNRALDFTNSAPGDVTSALQEAIASECKRFFHAASLKALSTVRDPVECVGLLRQTAGVFTAAGILSPSLIWEAALFCLKEAPLDTFDTIVGQWVLDDAQLGEALWAKGWQWSNLRSVLNILLGKCGENATAIAQVVRLLADRNTGATLAYLFGESQDLLKVMQPVVRVVVQSENSSVWPLVREWLVNASSLSANRDTLVRKYVANLLEVFPENSAEGETVLSAARALIALRQAALQSTSQPHLAPVAAFLQELQSATRSRSEVVRALNLDADEQNPRMTMETTQLSKGEADRVLALLCQNVAVYSFSELLTARQMVAALLERNPLQWRSVSDLHRAIASRRPAEGKQLLRQLEADTGMAFQSKEISDPTNGRTVQIHVGTLVGDVILGDKRQAESI